MADSTSEKKTAEKKSAEKKTAEKPHAAEVEVSSSLLRPDQVILRPLVTEKGVHRSSRHNAYAFEVAKGATKDDVRKAVEQLFNVKVLRVHTQNRKGKPRRSRFKSSYTKDWKKAIVKLDAEHRIELF
jgi:large subunit ribosomal protein L23